MDFRDFLLTPIYLLIIYFIAFNFKSRYPKENPIRKYFLSALTVKIFGALCFVLIYSFYYPGGDTFGYYQGAQVIWDVFRENPLLALKIYFLSAGKINPETYYYTQQIFFFNSDSTFIVVKITSLLGLLSFNSYLVISLFFAAISFTGVWAMYVTFTEIYPKLYKELAIAILFIPSVFFWGSGILKDSVTIGSLGWLTASFYSFFVKRRRLLPNFLVILFTGYLIFVIKSYIIFTLAPGLVFWIIVVYRSKIKSVFFKFLITPLVIGFTLMMNYLILEGLAKEEKKYSIERFATTASGFQNWHSYLGEKGGYGGGSAYSLGKFEATPEGILKVAPDAIVITLFRPYIWEVKNTAMLFAALESFIILIFTLRVIWQVGVFRIIRIIYNNPEVFFCIFFSLLFSFAIGFSTYNFGALVRYKIPAIPFYITALFIIRHINNNLKESPVTYSQF